MSGIKRKKPQAQIERQIIMAMVVSTQYLAEISSMPINPLDYLQIAFTQEVADWCLDYYEQYQEAPLRHIQDIYNAKVRAEELEEVMEGAISDFLASISEEYDDADKFNAGYILDETIKYFASVKVKDLSETLREDIEAGDPDAAREAIETFEFVERRKMKSVDPFEDDELVKRAFKAQEKPVMEMPGAFGEMVNSTLTRKSFVTFLAPEKRGKTWMMLHLAFWGFRSRIKVAFFSFGDMDEEQLTRRLMIYMAKRSDQEKYCRELLVPCLDCKRNQEDDCDIADRTNFFNLFGEETDDDGNQLKMSFEEAEEIGYKPCSSCSKYDPKEYVGAHWFEKREPVKPLTYREANKIKRVMKKRFRGRSFKMSFYPNDTGNVRDMEMELEGWERDEGFVPDLILCDYPDIMAPESDSRQLDVRHQINTTWKRLRRLSQVKHACLVAVTQADGKSYDQKTLKTNNYSEDKRKYSHLTACFGINQVKYEKKEGIWRINELMAREDESMEREVVCLGRLQMGRPILHSYWKPYEKE